MNKQSSTSRRQPHILLRLLRRFPISDKQNSSSLKTRESSSCYIFTIKKSGTHLLKSLIENLGISCINRLDYTAEPLVCPHTAEADAFVLSHELPSRRWRGSCQQGQARIIMNLRDPRAVFLSLLDFYDWSRPLSHGGMHTVEFRRASCRMAFKDREALGLALLEDELIDDDPFTPWLNFRRSRMLFHNPSVLKVRYEDFFATPDGGEGLVARICRYLGKPAPERPEALIAMAVSAPSPTRNASIPDRWRTELPPNLLKAFMAKHGDLVQEFGYPLE
jgi:hypothetical protein